MNSNDKPAGENAQAKNNEIKNPNLINAMELFKADPNRNTQATFIQQLLKSRLLVPCTAIKKEKTGENTQKVELKFMMLKNKQGENLFGVFTDWDEIKKQPNFPKEAAAMPFPEILKIATGSADSIKGVIINAFSQGLLLEVNVLKQLSENMANMAEQTKAMRTQTAAQQAVEQEKKTGTDDILYIGEPLEEPTELLKAFKKYFKGVKTISKAYFLEIYHSAKDSKPTPLVVIEYKGDKNGKETVYNEIETIYRENTEDKLKLTVMTAGEKTARDAIQNKKAFYTKGLFG